MVELDAAGHLRIALVADEPLAGWLSAAFDAVLVRPEDWRRVLDGRLPHLLVVQDARWGNAGAWQYRIAWTAHPDFLLLRDLSALAEWCAGRGVPTVFLATRPGPDAESFLPAARLFDLVVAPDRSTADRYFTDRRDRHAVAAVPTPADPAAAEELLVRIAATYGIVVASRAAHSLVAEDRDNLVSVSPDEW